MDNKRTAAALRCVQQDECDSSGKAVHGTGQQQTIVIDLPQGLGSLFGLGSVLSSLLMFSAWMIVGIGYICVPGSIVGAVLGIALGFMNLGNGLAAAAICLGCGVACLGMFYPVLCAAQAARRVLLKKTREAFSGGNAQ